MHRVEQWAGSHWASSWLINAGVEIHLGHGGAKCPNSGFWNQCSAVAQDDDDEWEENIPPAGESADGVASADALYIATGAPAISPADRGQLMNIVDVTGMHQLLVRPCRCPHNADSDDIQLLRMGLFPASFTVIKTAFTMRALDDFRNHNLGCNTTAYQYFNKIRRVTSPAFPHKVPVSRPHSDVNIAFDAFTEPVSRTHPSSPPISQSEIQEVARVRALKRRASARAAGTVLCSMPSAGRKSTTNVGY